MGRSSHHAAVSSETPRTTPRQLPVDPPPVAEVLFAARYERTSPTHTFQATSKPGHLLQYVVSGRVGQNCNGRHYQLGPGDLIWYHEDEWVDGHVEETPWVYYSVNFLAPRLPPPPFEARVVQRPVDEVRPVFERLLAAWRDEGQNTFTRACRVHAALLDLLGQTQMTPAGATDAAPVSSLWWNLEERVREDFSRRVSLSDLADWCGKAQATVVRSCRAAVDQSPMKRVKQVRMSFARGLVRFSDLNMSEIADRLGYSRVHEFSRDYRQHFGLPPSREAAEYRNGRTS